MPRMRRRSARTLLYLERQRRVSRQQQSDIITRFDSATTLFEDYVRSLCLFHCSICSRQCWSHELVSDVCRPCRNRTTASLFTEANGMDIGEIPAELKDLTMIEQLLIARVHPVVSVFKIRGRQTGYSGHTMNFVQHIEHIATRLPHAVSSLNSVILLNRTTPEGLVPFRVRSGRVRRALVWLKANNQYYRDITIDEYILGTLPDDNDVSHLLPTHISSEIEVQEPDTTESFDNLISSSGVPNLAAMDAAGSIDRHLQRLIPSPQNSSISQPLSEWPQVGNERLNEFVTEGLICRAFPCLFPFGRGDLRAPRFQTISAHKYFQYLIEYRDGRFANDPRFPYYAYNMMARWDAINCGNVFIRQNNMSGVSLQHLRDLANDPDRNLASQIMYYGSSLRGTRAYWKQRASELDQMVRQLGCPTIFFTLSAADYHWPDLFRILSPGSNPNDMSERQRASLMHENPLKTAKFFETRSLLFIDKFMKKFFAITDSWFRFEWQHRGSPHIHGMLWLSDAPDCTDLDHLDADSIGQICSYFDQLVSATVGQRFSIAPRDNPCRHRYSDLSLNEKASDLDKILSAVQIHSRCGAHCLRRRRSTRNFECRYGFPIELEATSALRKEDGYWKFFPARNDNFIQRYNKYLSQVWRGNTDFSPITSRDAVIRYISKYASKGEHGSESYSDLLSRLSSDSSDDSASATLIRQLMVSTVAERNYSSQEIMHLIMGWPLFHATRSFVILNTCQRWHRIGERQHDNLIDYYSRRVGSEDLTLYQFAKSYRIERATIVSRTKDCIVRVLPFLKLTGEVTNDESYFQQQCILHVPWRGVFHDLLPDSSTWNELYNSSIDEIRLRSAAFYSDPEITSDDDFELNDNDESDLRRDAGQAASRIHPGSQDPDPLGYRTIDEAHSWPDVEQAGAATDQITGFFRDLRQAPEIISNRTDIIPYDTFSGAQQDVVEICRNQIIDPQYPIKRLIVQGKAGSGKSAVIKYLCHLLDQSHADGDPVYQVVAPTGAAALNVDGQTIHSFFSIPMSSIYTPLNGEALRNFQLKMSRLRFLIIDEYSMVGMRLLTKIHKRLQEARPESTEPFSGINLYLFGDLRQLPPVMDIAIYMQPRDDFSRISASLVHSIQKLIILTVCHRQSADQVHFIRALDNLACGVSTEEDWRLLLTRRISIGPQNQHSFKDAVFLFPTNAQVREHNTRVLSTNGRPVAVIEAEHNNHVARHCEDPQAQGLPSKLYLSEGCRIMLRRNLNVPRGLVNGSLGTVEQIIYKQNEGPPLLPAVILIKFDRYRGPYFRDRFWPLLPVQVCWVERGVECKRRQFPINLAYALTVHKSQGLTLDKAIIDIGSKETSPGQSYVAFSRVRKLEDLMLYNSFDFPRLSAIGQLNHIRCREEFLRRMT